MVSSLQYDYIIAGAGCSGLSLAMHMIKDGRFSNKQVLLIDQDPKHSNDRTWCFWERGEGLFEEVVFKQWQRLWFNSSEYSKELDIFPYQYKMIRGGDFYEYCFRHISRQQNFSFLNEKIEHLFSSDLTTGVMVNGTAIHSQYVFNSILFEKPQLSQKQYWLLQHFKGWIIETDDGIFDPAVATLMDFRMPQEEGTAFCYVLPLSDKKALVEYTVFSPELLERAGYDEGLEYYIGKVLQIRSYRILEREFGVIPMTNFKFSQRQNNIINIGTAGGRTKGSSGYTFNFIQKHSRTLVERLHDQKNLVVPVSPKFSFYDSLLLNVLSNRVVEGRKIFTDMFRKNSPQRVLKFLDNETSLREDLGIISSLPTRPFFNAALWQLS